MTQPKRKNKMIRLKPKAKPTPKGTIIDVDYANYFHGLSEGYGFVLSLQFTYDANGNSYFSHNEVSIMLTALEAGNGFWDRTPEELDDMAAQIEAKL